ncbi:MAG: cryptochrome/photolyase family protein [Burkholderiales bacterium]
MKRTLVWFRRDLRFADHAALYHALNAARRVWCVFVFDTDILDRLPSKLDRRVEFIWHSLRELDALLVERGGGMAVLHGRAETEIPKFAQALKAEAVFVNRDYEPAAVRRDAAVGARLASLGIGFESFKDQVIFETDEIMTAAGSAYSVYTPYKNKWQKTLDDVAVKPYPVERHLSSLARPPAKSFPTLGQLGFENTNLLEIPIRPGMSGANVALEDFLQRIEQYDAQRNFPAVRGPSYLSVHLRFGTVSIRHLVACAMARGGRGAQTWLAELIWRDFYFQILHHYPRVVERAFRSDFDKLRFDNDASVLAAWCEGRTGYPLVDAAMRQINATGYMHNRLRMVVASFLVKDLHIHWQFGEKYFADHLNDFDLAANNGGWQWAASSGCDAQPYFRIFNPITQSEKFDPYGEFIRRYLPVLANVPDKLIHAPWRMSAPQQRAANCLIGVDYPRPIVDHDAARRTTLARYAAARKGLREVI